MAEQKYPQEYVTILPNLYYPKVKTILFNILDPFGARPPACTPMANHDDVIIWKHFPRYWPFVRGINRYKGQWRGVLVFSLICAWINSWVKNCEAGDLRLHLTHYDVIVMDNVACYISYEWTVNVVLIVTYICRYNFKELHKICINIYQPSKSFIRYVVIALNQHNITHIL